MKKKWTALLLALVLSLSLLPTAALAGEGTPTTGVYFAQQDGTPTGDCKTASQRSDFGNDGSVTLTGYWDIPYTEGTALTVYYYNAEMTELSGRNDQPVTTAKVDEAGHLWSVTLSSSASGNEEWADLNYKKANGGDSNFVMTFKRQAPVLSKPEKGLYFRRLEEGPNIPLHENEATGYISLNSITLAPFVDRMSMALYYFNGTLYEPVKRVRLPFGTGFDMMWVKERVEGAEDHWYYLSAYAFFKSRLYYYTGSDYDAPNAEPTGSVPLDSRKLPETAFYTSRSETANMLAYRIYTVMQSNQNPDFENYDYTVTLHVRSTVENFEFPEDVGVVSCFRKQYDKWGHECGDLRELKQGEDYDYTLNYSEDLLTFTIYANGTDLLFQLENEDKAYRAYVNLLAPLMTQIYVNDLGFSEEKYLPQHLLQEVAENEDQITLSAGDYAADIICDKNLTAAMAERSNVTLGVASVAAEEVMDAVSKENEDADFVGAVDITLAYGGEAQHTFTDGATATISYPCELELADGETVLVYYVYTEDGEEKTEQIEAVYDAAAKCVTFTTTHFSTFVIVTTPAPASAPGTSGGTSAPTYSVTVPKADHGTVKVSHRHAEQGDTVTVTVTPDKGYTLGSLTVLDKNGKKIEVTDKGNGKYTFKMPACKVTVEAVFMEDNTKLPFFADVPANTYYYDAVLWAAKNGVTGGVGENHFAPDRPCTRAQIVTFLWRAAGSPAPTRVSSFADVPADAYYVNAAAWAVENGITTGVTTDTFCPDRTCTRAQAVAFLFRYAASQGMAAVTLQELVSSHADAASVPGYALSAFNWALANGIVNGNDGNLMPNNDCTRAQIVTMLHRLPGN